MLKHPAFGEVHRCGDNVIVFMEKSEWACQAALGCSRSHAPLRSARCLGKLRELSAKAMEGLSGLSSALAEDPTQVLQDNVGSAGALPASAKHRRVPLAGFHVACVTVLVPDVAPEGYSQPPGHLSFRGYVQPRRTTTLAMYVRASQVDNRIGILRCKTNFGSGRKVS